MAGVYGDFRKLELLRKQVAVLRSREHREAVNQELGEEVTRRVQGCFERGYSPDGRKWAPLKYRKGLPLLKTYKLYTSINYRAYGTGFVVGTTVPYGVFHQYGTRTIPQRAFLPDPQMMPRGWVMAMEAIVRRAHAKVMG